MRIVAAADLHGELPDIPECDVLLIGGDIAPGHDRDAQREWLDGPFRAWLEAVPAGEVVATPGNHDFLLANEDPPGGLRWTYLIDATATVGGLSIHCTPWQPTFWGMYNADESELAGYFAAIPDGVDVLVAHTPPRGYGDRTTTGIDAGSTALLEAIDRARPRLTIFGHIHEGRGQWEREGMTLANVAICDLSFTAAYEPMSFELTA